MFRNILVDYDGSNSAKRALKKAAIMAKEYDAKITAIWVREPLPRHSDLPGEFEGEKEAADEYFKQRREEVTGIAKEHGVEIRCEVRSSHPAKTIVTAAD